MRTRRSALHSSLVALLTSAILVLSLLTIEPAAGGAVATSGRATATQVTGSASSASASAASALSKLPPGAKKALKQLVKQTGKVSKKALKSTSRSRLAKLLKLSRSAKSHARKQTCTSVKALASYRKTLTSTKVLKKPKKRAAKTLDRLAGLNTSSSNVSLLLLSSKKTRKCGGGVAMSTREEAQTTVLESTADHLKVAVQLPKVNLVPETEGGKTYTNMLAPDTITPGDPGQPGIPEVSELYGVPAGAQVAIDVNSSQSVTLDNVQLYPTQPDTVDDVAKPDFMAPPFTAAFVGPSPLKGTFPAKAASAKLLGSARDVLVGRAGISTGQYTPKTDTLKIYVSVVFTITFPGGIGAFPNLACSPWELSASRILAVLLNFAIVQGFCTHVPRRCGEELMVITNPSTAAEAATYAQARIQDGFRTHVYETGIGRLAIGATAAEIQTFIRSHLNSATCLRPSYVTIVGDDQLVPTFTTGPGGIPSDNPYSTKNDSDELPDVAVGRILGNDATELQHFIAKINHYQDSPPVGDMLTRASIAAQFQDVDESGGDPDGREARTFTQFAERARTGLMRRVVTVDRIYEDNPTTNPTTFYDGTAMPSSLQKPAFAWDGDAADISAAWNQGRFLMVHRDHGWSDGWGDPFYTTTEVNALTNDNNHLPVLMSVNCASAQYDTDDTSFVQSALVKETGGAVAAFGDTRNSPSWHNSEIALGFLDGLLPHVLLGEGPSSKQRVGDALVNGKLRLAGLAPPSGPGITGGDGNTRNELYLWHLFGDPTMKMYGGDKSFLVLDPKQFTAVYRELPNPNPGDPPPYEVEVTLPFGLAGQPISLFTLQQDLQIRQVVGKVIGDGSTHATIPADFNDESFEQLYVVVNSDDATPVTIPVSFPNTRS